MEIAFQAKVEIKGSQMCWSENSAHWIKMGMKRRAGKKFFWVCFMWHKIDYPCKWTSQFTDARAKKQVYKKERKNLAAKVILSLHLTRSLKLCRPLHRMALLLLLQLLCKKFPMNIYGQIIYRQKFYCDLIQFPLSILWTINFQW